MKKIDNNIIKTLTQLVTNCTIKREMLLQSALKRSKRTKLLSLWSGILALISAGAIITVLGKIFGSEVVQILAALLALTSGIFSLINNINYTVDDTAKIFEASSKYYTLSSKVHRILINPNKTSTALFEDINQLMDEYTALNEAYSKYDLFRLVSIKDQTNSKGVIPSFTGLQQYGYSSLNTYDIYKTTEDGKIPKRFTRYRNVTKAVKVELENLNDEIDQINNLEINSEE